MSGSIPIGDDVIASGGEHELAAADGAPKPVTGPTG
jgi:hypothetical protein